MSGTDRQIEEPARLARAVESKRAEVERVSHRPAAARVAEAELAELEAQVATLRTELGERVPPELRDGAAQRTLELAVRLHLAQVLEGEPIGLDATFTNRTGRRIVIWDEDRFHLFRYRSGDVYEAEPHDLPPCAPPMPRTLEPDASLTVRARVDKHLCFRKVGGGGSRLVALPMRTYALAVSKTLVKQGRDPDAWEGDAVSEPVTGVIEPREAVRVDRPEVGLGPNAAGALDRDRLLPATIGESVTREPQMLAFMVGHARQLIAYGSLAGMPVVEMQGLAWLAGDAGAAVWVGEEDRGMRFAKIGTREVTFRPVPPPSVAADPLWLHAFELAVIAGNQAARDALATVGPERIGAPAGWQRSATATRGCCARRSRSSSRTTGRGSPTRCRRPRTRACCASRR